MNFLVVNSDPVVMLDMIGILQDLWPTCVVETATTLTDACRAIKQLPELACAFVGLPLAEFDTTGLQAMIEEKNGKIVFSHFGVAATETSIAQRGWVPLAVPFTNETFEAASLSAGFVSR